MLKFFEIFIGLVVGYEEGKEEYASSIAWYSKKEIEEIEEKENY